MLFIPTLPAQATMLSNIEKHYSKMLRNVLQCFFMLRDYAAMQQDSTVDCNIQENLRWHVHQKTGSRAASGYALQLKTKQRQDIVSRKLRSSRQFNNNKHGVFLRIRSWQDTEKQSNFVGRYWGFRLQISYQFKAVKNGMQFQGCQPGIQPILL